MKGEIHKARDVEVSNRFGLTVYRVHCRCGWQSALVSSKKYAADSFDWHQKHGETPEPALCSRWGTGKDQCLKPIHHIGRCVTVDGDPIAAFGRQHMGREL
jgi:hypothetical protein